MNNKSTNIVIRDSATGLKIELLSEKQGYRFVSLKLGSMSKRLPHWRNGLYARIMRTNNMRGCRPKKATAEAISMQIVSETIAVPMLIAEQVTRKHTIRKSVGLCLLTYGYKGHRPSKGQPRVIDQRKLTKNDLTLLIKAIKGFACADVDAILLETAKQKALKYLGA